MKKDNRQSWFEDKFKNFSGTFELGLNESTRYNKYIKT